MSNNSEKSSAIHKVLDILLLFEDQQDRYSVEDISQLLDIPKSTVYRYIRILLNKGLLEKVGSAEYCLGLVVVEMGRTALGRDLGIHLIALPAMKRLSAETGDSVSLMYRYSQHAVCIECVEGQQALRVTIEVGRIQPLHAGASSKILLSGLPDDQWDEVLDIPLPRFTDTTITNLDSLFTCIQEIREQGYAVSNGEIDLGTLAVAVPLVDHRNEIVAALSIDSPTSRMDDTAINRYVELLQLAARGINEKM